MRRTTPACLRSPGGRTSIEQLSSFTGLLGPRTCFSGHKIEQGYELMKAGLVAAGRGGPRLCIEELSSGRGGQL